MDGPLTDEQVSLVRADFLRYTKDKVSYSQVAREVDLSGSVISQWASETYEGDNAQVARVLNAWMERHARKHRAAFPREFVSTTLAQNIQTIVDTACASSSMAAIVAPSGTGKTMLFELLAERYRGHYLYCTEDLTPRSFLRALSRLTGKVISAPQAETLQRVAERLKGTNRPIFLDEAHRLPPKTIPRVRSMHDLTGCPVIMAGTHEILDRIDDRSDGRGQFAGRTLQFNALDHVFNAEDSNPGGKRGGRPLFTREEIKQFLDGHKVRLEPDAFALAWAIACLPCHSCLRTLKRLVFLLRADPDTRSKPITRREILRALSLLFGKTGSYIGDVASRHLDAFPQEKPEAAAVA